MGGPKRVTEPLLDVLELLLHAMWDNKEMHGWAIMNGTRRSGPTVYGVLDRLEDLGWITGQFEERNDQPGRPPRRFYRLTPTGTTEAQQLVLERRPKATHQEDHQLPAAPARDTRKPRLAQLALRAVGLGGTR